MNGSGSCVIGEGSGSRFNMGDQVRAIFFTRFGKMDLEPYPAGRALFTGMGIKTRRASS
jgi:hypothetical protein